MHSFVLKEEHNCSYFQGSCTKFAPLKTKIYLHRHCFIESVAHAFYAVINCFAIVNKNRFVRVPKPWWEIIGVFDLVCARLAFMQEEEEEEELWETIGVAGGLRGLWELFLL